MVTRKSTIARMPRLRLRTTLVMLAFPLLGLMLAGCGRPPEFQTEPIRTDELEKIAGVIADHWGEPESLRASGTGRLSTSNSMTRFSFAALYDDPSWMRMDVRPTALITGPIANLQLHVDGVCSEAYISSLPLWIRGCLGDDWDGLDAIDIPALTLGLLTPRTLLAIGSPEVGMGDGLTVITGFVDGRTMTVTLTDDLRKLTRVEIGEGSGKGGVIIDYEGHGWKSGIPAPLTTTLVYDSRDTRPRELRLHFTRFRRAPPVDRAAHEIHVPTGLAPVGWDELELWR